MSGRKGPVAGRLCAFLAVPSFSSEKQFSEAVELCGGMAVVREWVRRIDVNLRLMRLHSHGMDVRFDQPPQDNLGWWAAYTEYRRLVYYGPEAI